jgi:hypothetical protein
MKIYLVVLVVLLLAVVGYRYKNKTKKEAGDIYPHF